MKTRNLIMYVMGLLMTPVMFAAAIAIWWLLPSETAFTVCCMAISGTATGLLLIVKSKLK